MPRVSSVREASSTHERSTLVKPEAWAQVQAGRTSTAILIVGKETSEAAETLKRCFATALPNTDVVPFVGGDRSALVCRMFAEVKASAYVVANHADDPLAVARAVAAIERDGADLVVVAALPEAAFADIGDHLLTMTLDYLYGCGGGPVDAVAVACSRRFAQSYAGDGTALDLTLHALRRRMPVDEVAMLNVANAGRPARPRRSVRDWLALAALIMRLFAEERPRRTFGLVGIAAIAAGIASATPAIRIHDWHAGLLPGWDSVLPLGLTGVGVGVMAAGLLLDAMAQARQDVSRIGYLAIPRSAVDQSSVS